MLLFFFSFFFFFFFFFLFCLSLSLSCSRFCALQYDELHAKLIEQAWASLCSWHYNIPVALTYVIMLAGYSGSPELLHHVSQTGADGTSIANFSSKHSWSSSCTCCFNILSSRSCSAQVIDFCLSIQLLTLMPSVHVPCFSLPLYSGGTVY